MSRTGDALYSTVVEYAELGDHRSGTDTDAATVEWFAAQLAGLGASSVERFPYEFERYDCRWSLALDGDSIPSIPLFYEGSGFIVAEGPAATTMRVLAGSAIPDFEEFALMALRDGASAAVIATDAGTPFLCAVNREIRAGTGLPTLLVANAIGPRLHDARIHLELEAEIVPAWSMNVRATLGASPDEKRVLLTTPLSGWFRCAGERGTGIAVCLAVARALAEECPVTVLGTNGHELGGVGIRHHMATRPTPEKAIFHFGASVASGQCDGVGTPTARTRGLVPTAWVGKARREALAEALSPLGLPARILSDSEARQPGAWIGESAGWAPLGKPLVSIAGGFALHHAPEDVPELATSPQLLSESYEAALAAARVFASS